MRISILACLFVFWANTLASPLSGPYQTLLFWYTYRLQVGQYGDDADKISIASECQGTASGQRCNFDEFLNWIKAAKNTMTYKTGLVDKWNVNFDNAVKEVILAKYGDGYNHERLLPKIYGEGGELYKHDAIYNAVIRAVTDQIRKVKAEKKLDKNTPGFVNIRTATNGIIRARTIDMESYLIQWIKTPIATYGKDLLVIEPTPWNRPGVEDKAIYKRVHFEKTLNNVEKAVKEQATKDGLDPPRIEEVLKDVRKQFKTWKYDFTTTYPLGKQHQRYIETTKKVKQATLETCT